VNKDWIASHLREAAEQLQETVKNLSSDSDYSDVDLTIEISHAYHHINTAWNSKDVSPDATSNFTDADYDAWQKMPSDDELIMGTLTENE